MLKTIIINEQIQRLLTDIISPPFAKIHQNEACIEISTR